MSPTHLLHHQGHVGLFELRNESRGMRTTSTSEPLAGGAGRSFYSQHPAGGAKVGGFSGCGPKRHFEFLRVFVLDEARRKLWQFLTRWIPLECFVFLCISMFIDVHRVAGKFMNEKCSDWRPGKPRHGPCDSASQPLSFWRMSFGA